MYQKTQDGSFIVAGAIGNIEHKTVGEKQSSLTKLSVKVGEKPAAVAGERGEAIWTNCDAWHGLSRLLRDSGAKKGDAVFACGKLESREYEGKTYKTLVCDCIIPAVIAPKQASQQTAAAGSASPDLSEFEELIADGEVPF